ncbi:MAG: hypothetical protein R3C26_15795 [Calditrichia bacterium]
MPSEKLPEGAPVCNRDWRVVPFANGDILLQIRFIHPNWRNAAEDSGASPFSAMEKAAVANRYLSPIFAPQQ